MDLYQARGPEPKAPAAQGHHIGVLVYGLLAHGLLSGQLQPREVPRGRLALFERRVQGSALRTNLTVVDHLGRLAHGLGITLGVAWTLANPAVDVAIVGTRNPDNVSGGIEAASADLDPAALARIEEIMDRVVPLTGPSSEGMPRD